MANRRSQVESQRGRLILVGVMSIIAFALVIVLYFQMKDREEDEPVSASAATPTASVDVRSNDGASDDGDSSESKEVVFAEGFTINGVNVSGKTLSETKTAVAESAGESPAKSVKVSFMVDGEKVDGDNTLLDFESNLDEMIENAWKASNNGDSQNKEFTVSWKASDASIEDFVHLALDAYEKEPVDAKAIAFDTESCTFTFEPEANGIDIDIEKVIDDMEKALENGQYDAEITVETTVLEPATTAEFLSGYLCKVSSTTSSTTSETNRNTNINLVCQKINGLVLQPGESFDFNSFIGQRTAEAGFKEAGGIYNGELRQELGGGICQANAMIFHSAVKADLQIDERSPHTWPSSYVETGTDATVSWGGPEFKFTNNSGYPIALKAYYGGQKVTVEVYGRPLPDGMTIKLKGEVTSRTEAKVEYVADSSMELDKKVTEKSSHDAIKAKAYKIWYDADGNEVKREEAFYSSYPMINKRVRVGTLASDGTVFKLNKETGETIAPEGYVPPTPTPDPDDTDDGDTDSDDGDGAKPTKKPKKQNDEPTGEAENVGEGSNSENDADSGSVDNGGSETENVPGSEENAGPGPEPVGNPEAMDTVDD